MIARKLNQFVKKFTLLKEGVDPSKDYQSRSKFVENSIERDIQFYNHDYAKKQAEFKSIRMAIKKNK